MSNIDSKNRTKTDSKIGKIEVDKDLCIGAGTCEVLAMKTFKLDSEAKAYVDDPEAESDDTVLDAAKSCPVFAIKIYDKDGKLVYPV